MKKGTKSYFVKTEDDIKKFIDAVVKRIISFFQEEIQLDAVEENYGFHEEHYINFKSLTSIISIEDCVKMTVVFNYDDALLKEAFRRYTKNIVMEEDEIEFYIDETAKDLINNIIGNVLSEFEQTDIIFEISVPIIIRRPEYIAKLKEIKAYAAKIKTEFGQMSIYCVIPGLAFLQEFCGTEE